MTTIYLHIGFGRSGSSAIQKFGIDNQHLLQSSQTLYYPEHAHNTSVHARGNHDLEEIISNDKARRVAEQYEGNIVIFSSEGMMLYDEEEIRAIYEYYPGNDIKVVAYLRRQDEYLHSWHNQAVKWRETCLVSCEELADELFFGDGDNLVALFNIENNRHRLQDIRCQLDLDYFHILEKWSQVFSTENIVVKVYDRDQLKNQDVVSDFFSLMDIAIEVSQDEQNRSLSDDYLSIALELNRHLVKTEWTSKDKEQFSEIIWRLNDSRDFGTEKRSNFLGNRYRRHILDRYRESNELIGQKYFGIGKRSPFSDVLPDSSEDIELPNPRGTCEILAAIVDELMIEKRKELEEIKCNYENSSSWKITRLFRVGRKAIKGIRRHVGEKS